MNPESVLRRLHEALDADSVLTDPADCWPYGYDNSRAHEAPLAVVLPKSHAEVVATVCAARDTGVPITARGLGTGTTGAAVPAPGSLVLSTEKLTALRIDPPNRVAVVSAGVTNGALQRAAAAHGFFWPPDPTSAEYSTVGGNLACNAAGPRALKYGTCRENTLGITAVAGNGATLRTGCNTTKGVVGYDFTRLLIGSEGTLAIITEAVLKLTPLADAVRTLRLVYADMTAAAHAVSRIMAQPVMPRVLEFMDDAAVSAARDYAGDVPPHGAGAVLLVQVDGPRTHLEDAVTAIHTAAKDDALIDFRVAHTEEETASLWAARKALSPALRNIAADKVNEDVVVPVACMGEFISALRRLSDRYGIPIVNFGHAGNGNIHVNLLTNPDDQAQSAGLDACLAEVFRTVIDFGGTLSGEHGVGTAKKAYLPLEIEPATLDLMRAVKRQFDPAGILNPGKALPDAAVQKQPSGPR